MKKIFNNSKSLSISSSSQPNEMINTANYTIGQNYSHFIGKTFQLSKHSVFVDDVIAEGGFSIVFLVKSNLNGKKYALKRMYVNNELDLEVCKREIQITKMLSEKNKKILKYIDSSIQRQTEDIYEILLLTKYCKLGGLVQLINDRISSGTGRLQENEILNIFCDICEALVDCHANGIIHRDLKIENILIDDELTDNKRHVTINYVLCDFGSATTNVYDRRSNNSISVALVADEINRYTTLSYRSPEMVDLYSNKPITTKSDIWALGCLLYKLCYFQVPFGESQLAIQEGRFTIPDAKANFYSKQINMLINYMLQPDPFKRPDIYQVSYLAFQLIQRPYPFKLLENTEAPNFNALTMPLTETEWRKNSLSAGSLHSGQSHNQQQQQTKTKPLISSETAVNPRERPKGNLNATNTIIPLTHSGAINNGANVIQIKPRNQSVANPSPNKLINVSIKPPQSTTHHHQPHPALPSQQRIGFDDDFNSLNPQKLPISPIQKQHHEQEVPHSIDYKSQFSTLEKKSHRRSASHSSTSIFQPMNNSITNQNPHISIETPHKDEFQFQQPHLMQQQNQQYQAYIQQQLQIQNQKQNQVTGLNQQLGATSSNQLIVHAPHHSRSASASPNVIAKINLAAQNSDEAEKKASNSQMNQISAVPAQIPVDQLLIRSGPSNDNPFSISTIAQPSSISTNSNRNTIPGSNNPFGDSFSHLNDNDLFGLEFDWIRQNNSNSSLNLDMSNKFETKKTDNNKQEKYNKKYKNQKEASSTILKLADRSRSKLLSNESMVSTSSTLSTSESKTQPSSMQSTSPAEEHSSSSSDRSSTCVESVEKKHNSKSSQYSSSTTIVSVDSSAFSKFDDPIPSVSKSKNKKNLNSTRIQADDPFRCAPFRIQPVVDLNSSSSNSSDEPNEKEKNKNEDPKNIASSQQHLSNNLSAFQPYKRPPDPFVSAPFDHVPPIVSSTFSDIGKTLKTGKSSSPTSSITPTGSTSVYSSGGSKTKRKQIDPSTRKRSTTVNYRSSTNFDDSIQNSCNNLRTQSKKNSIPNPFINAPFTAKKVKPVQSSSSHTLKTSNSNNFPISSSNSLNSIDETQITPTVSNYPSIDSNVTPVAVTAAQLEQSFASLSFKKQSYFGHENNNRQVVKTINEQIDLLNNSSNCSSSSSGPHVIKIPQSHSLNEIKQQQYEPVTAFKLLVQDGEDTKSNPIVDTSKLQFKKRQPTTNTQFNQGSMQTQNTTNTNSKLADNNIDKSINFVKKIPLTKSCSANSTINTNIVNNNGTKSINNNKKPTTNAGSTATSGGGGIANMSFDDY